MPWQIVRWALHLELMRCATKAARILGFIVCVGLCLRSVRVCEDSQRAVADKFGCRTLSDSEFYRAND